MALCECAQLDDGLLLLLLEWCLSLSYSVYVRLVFALRKLQRNKGYKVSFIKNASKKRQTFLIFYWAPSPFSPVSWDSYLEHRRKKE